MKKRIIITLLLSYLTIHGVVYAAPLPTGNQQAPQEDLDALRADIEQQHDEYLKSEQHKKDMMIAQDTAKAKLIGALVGTGIGLTTGNLYYHAAEAITDAYPTEKTYTSANVNFLCPLGDIGAAYLDYRINYHITQNLKRKIETTYGNYKNAQQQLLTPQGTPSLITLIKNHQKNLNSSYKQLNSPPNILTNILNRIDTFFCCCLLGKLSLQHGIGLIRRNPIQWHTQKISKVAVPVLSKAESMIRLNAVNKAQEALTKRGITSNPTWMSRAATIASYFHIHRDKDNRFGFGIRCNFFYDMPF